MTTIVPDVVFASGPTYKSSPTSQAMLMPFTYSNGKLDLPSSSYTNNDGSGDPIGNHGASIRLLGGNFLVTSIGTNLQAFIRSKTWSGYTPTNDKIIVIPSFVTRVQQLDMMFLPANWDQVSYKVTEGAWNNANFIGPNSVFLLLKPLVLQMKGTKSGQTKTICITLQTFWDH